VFKIKNSVPPQRKRSCVCITQTNLLVLYREIIVCYSENHTKNQSLHVANILIKCWMLIHGVYIQQPMWRQGRNPKAVKNLLFSSYLCYCKYTELMNGYSSRFVVYILCFIFRTWETWQRGETLRLSHAAFVYWKSILRKFCLQIGYITRLCKYEFRMPGLGAFQGTQAAHLWY
jgi:hypothetical protein